MIRLKSITLPINPDPRRTWLPLTSDNFIADISINRPKVAAVGIQSLVQRVETACPYSFGNRVQPLFMALCLEKVG